MMSCIKTKMSNLDFVSVQADKAKKGINIITFIATVLFVIAVGVVIFAGIKYWNKMNMEDDLVLVRSERRSSNYKEAMAFQNVSKDLEVIERNFLNIGTIVTDVYNKTIDGVVYESVAFSADKSGGGELKLVGIFSDLNLIDEQVKMYQEVEGGPLVTTNLEGDNVGKSISSNSQAATFYLKF